MFSSGNEPKVPATTKELRRLSILRRYSSVAHDLPEWAKNILGSKMGTIEVSAKDSFEIYLSSIQGILPKYDFISFQKRFVEIFSQKAFLVLNKIAENREKNNSFYISNDYFWQEFRDLFTEGGPTQTGPWPRILEMVEHLFWNFWNKKIIGVFGFSRALAKVGLTGFLMNRRYSPKHNRSGINPIRGK